MNLRGFSPKCSIWPPPPIRHKRVHVRVHVSDNHALFWFSVLIILRIARIDTLVMFCGTAGLILLLACTRICCQNQSYSYEIGLIKKECSYFDEQGISLVYSLQLASFYDYWNTSINRFYWH